jgi:rare lipoprotein A
MNRVLACLLATMLLVAGLGAAPAPADRGTNQGSRVKPVKAENTYQVGRASWYGKFFHGKTTASGEDFDMFQFTAAHRDLRLGTYLKVTNLRNDRWVIVRVNDRGPVPKDRIIDLSYGAAQVLGFRERGIEKVRLEIVEPDETAVEASVAGAR